MPTLDSAASALTAAGYTCKPWKGERLYLRIDGKDVGYITESDVDGSTGTCSNVTRRAGSVAAILRANL